MRFSGNIEARTDNKGRVFIPACFRRILQAENCEKLILRQDPHQQCLVLYPESTWNAILDELSSQLSRWSSADRMIFRKFVANIDELSIDSNGRILLQKKFRDTAAIGQEVCFIGMDDTIEIWAKDKLEALLAGSDDFGAELEKVMNKEKGGDNE
ncbi:MAG: division/cell wall cluster transcriptional repressor MraZ [Bacteroidaceae bacterium]|nr:division/cell wall cluster transcriptional repressor MraZ [Bacteroidaceae bacterium]